MPTNTVSLSSLARKLAGEMSQSIMDFPQAWDYVRETELDEHDPKCSYRVCQRGMLCDCFILWDEYERRKAAILDLKSGNRESGVEEKS